MTDFEDDEHLRYARYLKEFEAVGDDEELELVRTVLGDPDTTMAQAAVCQHIDRKARKLFEGPEFPDWAAKLDRVVERPFLVQRIREWGVLRALRGGDPGHETELIEGSNWLQQQALSDDTAALLAEHGRTKSTRRQAAHQVRMREARLRKARAR